MSRVGKKPVPIPEGVEVAIDGQTVTAKGKTTLSARLPRQVEAKTEDAGVVVSLRADAADEARYWGLARSLLANLVQGAAKDFEKKLEIQGVGYRAQMQGKTLKLSLGYSQDIMFAVPDGIQIACATQTEVSVQGANKQQVGQVAAEIRRLRPAEPYKGKGVRYVGEYVERKEGKKK